MAELTGSPAVDSGSNAAVTNPPFPGASPFTDQRGTGFARIVNGTVDIGAYEAQAPTAVTVVAPCISPAEPKRAPVCWAASR